jgi:RNA polymerase sigma-70 factor (ECF subfamily)
MAVKQGFYTEVDQRQLELAKRGDLDAMAILYRTFSLPVFNLACRLCRSRDEAEDVLQETFLEVVRSLKSFRGEGVFGAWLRRVTVTKALARMRVVRRLRVEVVSSLDPVEGRVDHLMGVVEGGEGGWRRVDLERALSTLPDASRAVVWLHDVEGMTHAEIASHFGRSVSFSKSQLSRAHARLRRLLGSPGGSNHASKSARTARSAGR